MTEEAYYLGYQRLKTIRDGMFGIQGSKLFNCLSREFCARGGTEDPKLLEKLKRKLNTALTTIPDEPRLPSVAGEHN